MNEGIGGATVLTIIIVFVVVVSSYMAFNVNYTKAFRVKNKVVDSFNKYGTKCRNVTDASNICNKEIREYAESIGYTPKMVKCPTANVTDNSYPVSTQYYCAISHKKPKSNNTREYYDTMITVRVLYNTIKEYSMVYDENSRYLTESILKKVCSSRMPIMTLSE